MGNRVHASDGRLRIRRSVGAFVLLLLVGAPGALAAQSSATNSDYPDGKWSPPAAAYGTSEDSNVQIRMDDGAILLADVVYPTNPTTGQRAKGPFPVLLNQDLYSGAYDTMAEKAVGQGSVPDAYLVQHGYIVVHLHDRGTGGSQGQPDATMGPRIGLDGTEVAYWAANPRNVPGSDGKVGLEGCSALGFIQLPTLAALGALERQNDDVYVPGPTANDPGTYVPATAATNPIKASIPACPASDLYLEQFSDDGIPSTFVWTLSAAQPASQAVLIGLNTNNPSSNAQETAMFADMMAGGDSGYYRDFWEQRDNVRNAADVARTGAAILMWAGWGESGFMGTQWMYSSLQNFAAGRPTYLPMVTGQKVSPKYQFIIGDWGHSGGLDNGIELEWFDTWMQGVNTGLQYSTAPMHMWEEQPENPDAAVGRWINASTLPMTNNYTPLYLDASGTLSSSRPKTDSSDSLVWGTPSSVTYSLTKPYGQDMTLIGPRALQLWIGSTNTNAQIYAELDDVAPGTSGAVTEITHGSILASRQQAVANNPDHVRSWTASNGLPMQPYLALDQDRYITPSKPVELDIPLQEVTWRLQAGHVLALKLATNAGADCPGNTTVRQAGIPVFSAPVGCILSEPMVQSLTGGDYTIFHGPSYPSAVNLPLVPSRSFATVPSAATPTSSGIALPMNWSS